MLHSPQDRMSKRAGEQLVEVSVQVAEDISEEFMEGALWSAHGEQIVDQLEEQIVQVGKVIPKERFSERIKKQIGDLSFLRLWRDFGGGASLSAQERISERTVEHLNCELGSS